MRELTRDHKLISLFFIVPSSTMFSPLFSSKFHVNVLSIFLLYLMYIFSMSFPSIVAGGLCEQSAAAAHAGGLCEQNAAAAHPSISSPTNMGYSCGMLWTIVFRTRAHHSDNSNRRRPSARPMMYVMKIVRDDPVHIIYFGVVHCCTLVPGTDT